MLHEDAQADILCEVVSTFHSRILGSERRGVDSHLDLSLIGIPGLGHEESGHGEPFLHNVLGILDGLLKKYLEVLIAGIFLVLGILPLDNGLTLPYGDIEEGVEEQDHIVLERVNVEEDWVGLLGIQLVLHERGLDNDEGV